MRVKAVVLDGVVIHIGAWGDGLRQAPLGPLPEGAVEGDFDIQQTSRGEFVLSADYAALRRAEYPSIEDQLDALFHAGAFPAEMAQRIAEVKARYPKTEISALQNLESKPATDAKP